MKMPHFTKLLNDASLQIFQSATTNKENQERPKKTIHAPSIVFPAVSDNFSSSITVLMNIIHSGYSHFLVLGRLIPSPSLHPVFAVSKTEGEGRGLHTT